MFYLRHRLVVWWFTLGIILAGSLTHPAHSSLGNPADTADSIITLEICSPTGELLSYTLDFPHSHGHHLHDAAHCLFCVLPGAVDTPIIESTVIAWVDFSTITQIKFPPSHQVPNPLDFWHPHHALDPPPFV